MKLSGEQMQLAQDIYNKIITKETAVIKRSGEKIPYTTVNGIFDDKFATDPSWWTNGFWHGILWLVFLETKDESIRALAGKLEEKMDSVLYDSESTHHDVGFMWLLSSVANWRITGDADSKRRAIIAANYLLARFNSDSGFITAWNSVEKEGWSIIDTMMNLPLLYWAGEETGYERYGKAARKHADKTLEHVVRPDGSVIHIIEYSLADGSVIQSFGGQGYEAGSSWTRGQAWALYGFVLSYLHTHNSAYLETAKKVAHYFLAAVAQHGYVPPIDFRSPMEPVYHDTTAGAIAACGLIEIAKALKGTNESAMYLDGAMRILSALTEKHADFGESSDAILHNGSEAYPPRPVHLDIIYGDYYYIEAFCKLCGKDYNLW